MNATPSRHESRVWYWLSGTFEPSVISERTTLQPSRAASAGDLVTPNSTHRHKDSGWWVEPDLPRSVDVEAQLDALIAILKASWDELMTLGREFDAGVNVVIYSYDAQGPLITIRPDVSVALHQLNATLDFDLYNMTGAADD